MADILTTDAQSLIFGFTVNSGGEITELDWQALKELDVNDPGQWTWVHMNRRAQDTQDWLRDKGVPDEVVLAALLQDDTRPRIVRHGEGYLLNLRGANLNEGADPEDMIAVRMWATNRCVITTRGHRIRAAEDVRDHFRAGTPPKGSAALIAFFAKRLIARMAPVITELDEQVDELEEQLLSGSTPESRSSISEVRRTAVTLRRYMSPQRDALSSFLEDSDSFLLGDDRLSVRETQDALIRLLEDLNVIRERALLLHEQLEVERADAMNARLFVLSVISAVFLPLGFFTGLFGVNVGGMPGVDSPFAFAILCLSMVLCALLIIWLVHRLRWI